MIPPPLRLSSTFAHRAGTTRDVSSRVCFFFAGVADISRQNAQLRPRFRDICAWCRKSPAQKAFFVCIHYIDSPGFRWYIMSKSYRNKGIDEDGICSEFSESRGRWKPDKESQNFPSLLSRKPQRFTTQ